MSKAKKSQAWSFDIILAVVVFVIAFFIFYAFLKPQAEDPVEDLRSCAEVISSELLSDSSPLNLAEDVFVEDQKLQDLVDEAYSSLKNKTKAGCDFCIHFEDDQGNVIYIRSTVDKNVSGVGSPKINVSNITCS